MTKPVITDRQTPPLDHAENTAFSQVEETANDTSSTPPRPPTPVAARANRIAEAIQAFFARNDNARRLKYHLAMKLYGEGLPATHNLAKHFPELELDNAKDKYMLFCKELSEKAKLELSASTDARDGIIKQLCEKKYFDLEIYSLLKAYVTRMYTAYYDAAHESTPDIAQHFQGDGEVFAQFLLDMLEPLKMSPDQKHPLTRAAERASGAVLGGALRLNIPNARCVYTFGATQIAMLRHPTPTTDASWTSLGTGLLSRVTGGVTGNGEEVLPEFALALEGKKHLLCVHMRSDRAVFEHEGGKVKAILDFANKVGLDLLVQPLDGPFFHKEGAFAVVKTFAELKVHMYDNFKKGENMCCISTSMEDEALYARMEELLEMTHKAFFGGKERIESDAEWKLFQIYFYIIQSTDRMIATKTTSFSAFCRESSDRGGIMGFIRDLVYAKMMRKGDDPKIREHAFYNMMGAAIMAKREPVMESRFTLAIDAIKHLSSLSDDALDAIVFPENAVPTEIIVKELDRQEIPPEKEEDMVSSTSSTESTS